MRKFKVYFEIYGKKMVATVSADNSTEAQKAILNKVVFHKTEQLPQTEQEKDKFQRNFDAFMEGLTSK